MSAEPSPQGGQRGSSVLRVFRVQPGDQVTMRILSPRYRGLFTHYSRTGSAVCLGSDCNPSLHRTDIFWKGYAAVEIWNLENTAWIPWVLEITENTELDFRGKWQRGQVWELSRARSQVKRKTPVVAVLLAERQEEEPPAEFDFLDTLCRLYHTTCLNLDQANPLPPRTVVTWSKGSPPPSRLQQQRDAERQASQQAKGTTLNFKELRERKLDENRGRE